MRPTGDTASTSASARGPHDTPRDSPPLHVAKARRLPTSDSRGATPTDTAAKPALAAARLRFPERRREATAAAPEGLAPASGVRHSLSFASARSVRHAARSDNSHGRGRGMGNRAPNDQDGSDARRQHAPLARQTAARVRRRRRGRHRGGLLAVRRGVGARRGGPPRLRGPDLPGYRGSTAFVRYVGGTLKSEDCEAEGRACGPTPAIGAMAPRPDGRPSRVVRPR